MNTRTAITLSHEVAALIGLCASFQAKYGRNYKLKPGSDPEAWTLYQTIVDQQALIAELLDYDALEHPYENLSRWWQRQDAIDLTVAYKIMEETNRLIAACAYFEAEAPDSEKSRSYTVFSTQTMIAGMLHPCTRQIALGKLESHSQKAG